jgi:hypothetical protein
LALERTRIDLQSIFRLTELADYIIPFTIGVVAHLGVADHLVDGPQPVEQLATATGTHAPSLHRALRALACKGIFTEVEDGLFGLTPMAELLRSDHPLSLREGFPLLPASVQAWARFDHSIRTGEAAFDYVHGQSFWDYLADHPEESVRFDRSQQAMTRLELRAALHAYDWSSLGIVVDVGGGNGAFLAGLLTHHTAMRGVLLDLPQVVSRAAAILKEAGVADRCQLVEGNYFHTVPAGGDAYLLKRILWGYHDEKASAILRNIRAAMRSDSRLVVLEPLMRPGDAYDFGKIHDLLMLTMGGGGARNLEQMNELFAGAHLQIAQVSTTVLTSIVEGLPA